MGTHPIFESDFDCLTDLRIKLKRPDVMRFGAQQKPKLGRNGFPGPPGVLIGAALSEVIKMLKMRKHYLFFLSFKLQSLCFQLLLVVFIVAAVTVTLLTRNKMSLVAVVLQPLS